MKEYKSTHDLLVYLESKNVIIKNREQAIKKIERYSYYSIINSYKSVFKERSNDYKQQVSFEEIFALYEFDKNIKSIFLKYILEIELMIKSLMANLLAKNYGLEHYLKIENFDNYKNEQLISKLIDTINHEVDSNKKHDAVKHYRNKYGFVPPFVLTKVLTFGMISKYYGLLKQRDRQQISKYFKLSDNLLAQILRNLTLVRNISAHSDRLFCFSSNMYVSLKGIIKKYEGYINLYVIIQCMGLLLDNQEYDEFVVSFNKEIENLKEKLSSIDIDDILNIMGYDL